MDIFEFGKQDRELRKVPHLGIGKFPMDKPGHGSSGGAHDQTEQS